MYASLDVMDVRLEPRDGIERVIQTDHRARSAIAAERHLSVVFAVVRCVTPLRSPEPVAVIYNCRADPPKFLRAAVKAAGAELWVGDDVSFLANPTRPPEVDVAAVDALMNGAMHELAVAAAAHASDFLDGLRVAEREFAVSGYPEPADEPAFWRAVVTLAALTGEALRASAAGAWTYNPDALGTLPFTYGARFQGDRAAVNPLGKAIKFIRGRGDGEEPSFLVQAILESP